MNCAFCQAPAIYVCSWPVERPALVYPREIRHGDILAEPGGCSEAWIQVLEITLNFGFFFKCKPVRLPKSLRGTIQRDGTILIGRHSDQKVYRWEPASCGTPACEAHVREVADDRHYCADHWNAWAEAAA